MPASYILSIFMFPPVSFEFFPPKSADDLVKLHVNIEALTAFHPRYFSVTHGAGGRTQQFTHETVFSLQNKHPVPIAPHLTCLGLQREQIAAQLEGYRAKNIHHLVALRGDLPIDSTVESDFKFAIELIEFVRATTGKYFHIHVAGYPEPHPQAESLTHDIHFLQQKVAAGADNVITQYFYNPDAYFYFVERCDKKGIRVPIVPGIMPITNFKNLQRFSKMCGAEIPLWLLKNLESYGEDVESLQSFGVDVVTRLCETLLRGGAPALHFYTLNQAKPSVRILENLS